MARFSNTLSRAVVGAGALALVATTAATLARPARLDAHAAGPADSWLKSKAKHRQRFDFPASAGGIPLVHIMNQYETWNKAYGVLDKDINAVGTFYGATTFFGVSDAMWAKYRIGEFLSEKDGTGGPATKNPWS